VVTRLEPVLPDDHDGDCGGEGGRAEDAAWSRSFMGTLSMDSGGEADQGLLLDSRGAHTVTFCC